jgi:hypothetical protein
LLSQIHNLHRYVEDVLAGYWSEGLSALRSDLDLLDADFCVAAPAAHLRLADMVGAHL